MSSPASEEDEALSAALGWPGGISDPILDRAALLRLVASATVELASMRQCFDAADRAITQFTMKGELVFDPFGGLMTVPYRALKLGRTGRGHELNPRYFFDGVQYLKAMEREVSMPTLFDLDEPMKEAA